MCGRYVSKVDASLEREWELHGPVPLFESYNVAPTQSVPVIRIRNGQRVCELIRWGLVPSWTRGIRPKFSTINARIETISTAATYRSPWARGQRCILPAIGFYEWHQLDGGRKQPYFITLDDQPVFGFAGLWEASRADDGATLESCTIITMPANPFMAEIHHGARMPAILHREHHDRWLAGSVDEALGLLQPYPQSHMRAHTVSTAVGSPKNDDPRLIVPAAPVS